MAVNVAVRVMLPVKEEDCVEDELGVRDRVDVLVMLEVCDELRVGDGLIVEEVVDEKDLDCDGDAELLFVWLAVVDWLDVALGLPGCV